MPGIIPGCPNFHSYCNSGSHLNAPVWALVWRKGRESVVVVILAIRMLTNTYMLYLVLGLYYTENVGLLDLFLRKIKYNYKLASSPGGMIVNYK